MIDPLTKGFGGDLVPSGNDPQRDPKSPIAPEDAHATPEDEAAATDPLGRTTDGPTAVNRDVPPTGDHYGRDTETGG